jgi:hypothetical protein
MTDLDEPDVIRLSGEPFSCPGHAWRHDPCDLVITQDFDGRDVGTVLYTGQPVAMLVAENMEWTLLRSFTPIGPNEHGQCLVDFLFSFGFISEQAQQKFVSTEMNPWNEYEALLELGNEPERSQITSWMTWALKIMRHHVSIQGIGRSEGLPS